MNSRILALSVGPGCGNTAGVHFASQILFAFYRCTILINIIF